MLAAKKNIRQAKELQRRILFGAGEK